MVSRFRQTGTVLIVALLVFALVEVTLLFMINLHGFDVVGTKDIQSYSKRNQILLGAEKTAAEFLVNAKSEPAKASWLLAPIPTSEGVMTIEIVDLQAKLNLNHFRLGLPYDLDSFLNAFEATNINRESLKTFLFRNKNAFLEQAFKAQPDDQNEDQNRAQSQDLASLTTSLQGPGSTELLTSVSELLEMEAVSATDFLQLLPFVTTIEQAAPVNLNTASVPVLMSLSKEMTPSLAQDIISRRAEMPFENVDQAFEGDAFKGLNLNQALVTLDSKFYRADIRLEADGHVIRLYTWMRVNQENDYMNIQIISRSFGAL